MNLAERNAIFTVCPDCESNQFYAYHTTRVDYLNKDGVLHPDFEDKFGLDSSIFCCRCDREFKFCNFKEVL